MAYHVALSGIPPPLYVCQHQIHGLSVLWLFNGSVKCKLTCDLEVSYLSLGMLVDSINPYRDHLNNFFNFVKEKKNTQHILTPYLPKNGLNQPESVFLVSV